MSVEETDNTKVPIKWWSNVLIILASLCAIVYGITAIIMITGLVKYPYIIVQNFVKGAVMLIPSALIAAAIGIIAYVISIRIYKGTNVRSWKPSAIFLATWLIGIACLLLIRDKVYINVTLINDILQQSSDTSLNAKATLIESSLESVNARSNTLTLMYVLPTSIMLMLMSSLVLIIRLRWIQWLVTGLIYTPLCLAVGSLDLLLI